MSRGTEQILGVVLLPGDDPALTLALGFDLKETLLVVRDAAVLEPVRHGGLRNVADLGYRLAATEDGYGLVVGHNRNLSML